jgi:hypothetical protein
MNPMLAYYYTALLLAVLAGAWLLLGWLSSLLGGWSKLASRYQLRRPFTGKTFPTRSAMMGMTRYASCLTMGVNQEGLYLEVFIWMRISHPPLFIPWTDMAGKIEDSWLTKILVLTFKPVPQVSMELPMNTVLELKEAAHNPKAFPEID